MRKPTKFPKLVAEEAKNLRKLTTSEEKANLNFDVFDSNMSGSCIYGQLTGYCHSTRAVYLMMKSAKRVYTPAPATSLAVAVSRPGASKILSGKPKEPRSSANILYWSPIEVFIDRENTPKEMQKRLLEYIKGTKRRLE